MSEAITRGIRIQVNSVYLPDRSEPSLERYTFAYKVRISNESASGVKLVSRHWVITDGDGQVEEVSGPGVVGEQPHMAPGEGFEYTSFCPLPTVVGTMQGSYEMVEDSGERFDAEIAPFTLALPHALN